MIVTPGAVRHFKSPFLRTPRDLICCTSGVPRFASNVFTNISAYTSLPAGSCKSALHVVSSRVIVGEWRVIVEEWRDIVEEWRVIVGEWRVIVEE